MKYGWLNGTAIYTIPGTSKVVLSSANPAVAINLVLHASDTFSRFDVPDGYGVVLRETSMTHAHANGGDDLPERLQTMWSMGTLSIVSVPLEDIPQIALCRHSMQIRIVPKMPTAPARAVFDESEAKQKAGSNKRIGEACSTAAKAAAVRRLNRGSYTQWMKEISGEVGVSIKGQPERFTTRCACNSAMSQLVVDWLEEQCAALGLEVEIQTFNVGGMNGLMNVICKKHPSAGATASVFVLGAHYDSTAERTSRETDAPGAVDNGSGAAGVLAVAEALQAVNLKQTVHFVFFGAEEMGIYGSYHYVGNAVSEGWAVSGAAIMDMIGYSSGNHFGVTVEYQGGSTGTELARNAFGNMEKYGAGGVNGEYYGDSTGASLTTRYMYSPWGSDHVPFIQAGVPCFLAIQRDDINYFAYHSIKDKESSMNYDQAMGILRMMVSTLYDNSCAPEQAVVPVTSAPAPAQVVPTPAPAPVQCESTRGIRPVAPFSCPAGKNRKRRKDD